MASIHSIEQLIYKNKRMVLKRVVLKGFKGRSKSFVNDFAGVVFVNDLFDLG